MKIVLAADGSKFTKKALAFLITNEELAGDDEVLIVNVQAVMPPRVRSMVGSAAVNAYQSDEAEAVLAPIRKLLERRKGLAWRCDWKVGEPSSQILAAAERAKAHMIVMGTHGYGAIGRAVMGSVAHRVLQGAKVPVLLVR